MPLSEGVIVVADVHRNFGELQTVRAHFFNKLARVFHAVHRKADFTNGRHAEHAVSVMRIRKADSGNEPGKHPSSHEDDFSEKRNVRIGFYDEARSKNHVERGIFGKRFDKGAHIGDVVLSIGIERHYEINSKSIGKPSKEFQTRFKCGSPAPVLRMVHRKNVVSPRENRRSGVFRSVVHYENFRIPR